MIIKKRQKPQQLQKLESLIPRLSPQHPNIENIKTDIAKRRKGYIGEQKTDYYIERLPIPCTIIQDACLEHNHHTFQIDTLILTKHAIHIIETKNLNGTITFDTTLQQLIREHGKIEQGFNYPLTQAQHHKHQLQQWLADHNIQNIPIHYLIAISEPSTIIRVHGDEQLIAKHVTHAANLNNKIQTQNQNTTTQNHNHRKIGHIIKQACKPSDHDILRRHNIQPQHIQPGITCPNCQKNTMNRHYGKWHCTTCQHTNKHAHKTAINDHLLLIKPYITNQQCRTFLHIKSRYLANRLLKSANLTFNKKIQAWQRK